MATKVILPKLGLTMQEGVIEEWVAAPGTAVKPGDILMRIGTDKVDADVEAEESGLFHPIVATGVTLPPGALVGWLLAEGEKLPDSGTPQTAVLGDVDTPQAADAGAARADASQLLERATATAPHNGTRLKASPNARRIASANAIDLSALRGTGPGGRIVSEDVEEAIQRRGAAATAEPPRTAAVPSGLVISPLVRRFADEQGVDLATVTPTGAGGRVRRSDIETALRQQLSAATPAAAKQPASPATPPSRYRPGQVIPLSGMRGAIARNMHASLQEMAQLTHSYEADVSALVAVRKQLKDEAAADGSLRVPSLNDFLVKAAALALLRHPLLNASVRDDGIHLLEEIHVGFAVAVPDGLVVPVLRNAGARSLPDLAREAVELAGAARAGRLSLPQLEGATFTVSSLGGYGVDFFTPVVNPGNVAILGVGRVRDGVRWEGETPHRTSVLTLSLSFDHRAVDGAPAAEFLRTVTGLLSRPLLLLAS